MTKIYAVMGATGQIGKVLTKRLLEQGHTVHAIARDPDKLSVLESRGAKIYSGNFDDAMFLTEAFLGVDSVFSFVPPGYFIDDYSLYADKVAEAIQTALIYTKVPYIVNLSSLGAHIPDGTGVIKLLYLLEKRLNAVAGTNILHLRPAYFMENFYSTIESIKKEGVIKSALKLDLKIPMIATKDIAESAALFLNRLDFNERSVFEMVGPNAITMGEATALLAKEINKSDLRYQQVSYEEMERILLSYGMKLSSAKLLVEMYKALNEGKIVATQPISPEQQGKTTFEAFAKQFAEVYNSTV